MNKENQFNIIVSENQERIRRICNYYCSGIEDRQDIYQEVLVNIWKSLENFRGDSTISTWIYRIAVNTALTYTGKVYKNMKLMVNGHMQNLKPVLEEDALQQKLILEEQFEALQTELNLLPVIDKALISLMLEGLSMKEIADVIGITEPNVKVKLHRIKAHLKEKMKRKKYECHE